MFDPKALQVISGIGMGLCGVGALANTKLEWDKKKSLDELLSDTSAIRRNTNEIANMMTVSPQFQQKKEMGITAEQFQETLINAMKAIIPQQPVTPVQPVQQQQYGYGYAANTQQQHDSNQQLYDYLASQRANADLTAANLKLERENDDLKNKINDLTIKVAQIQYQPQVQYQQPAYNPNYDARLNALESSISTLANGMTALVQSQAPHQAYQQPQYQQPYQQTSPAHNYGPITDDQFRRVMGQAGMSGLATQPL